ncbi:MAG: cache domain-containing protein, partial [Candidatus Omnitrophota bacterium]
MKDHKLKHKTGIRRKITMLVCATVLIAMISGLSLGYLLGYNLLQNTIGENHSEMAWQLAFIVSGLIEKEMEQIETYSSRLLWQEAIIKSNLKYENMKSPDIESSLIDMDKKWAVAGDDSPLIKEYLENKAGRSARAILEKKEGIAEIFITDKYGGLVASSGKTSDFYQADEEWWKKTFNEGKGSVYVGDIEFDESADIWAMPFAVPIRDGENNVVGICKAVVDVTAFFMPLGKFKVGRTGHAVLVNTEGDIIFHSGITPLSTKGCSEEELQRVFNSKDKWLIMDSPHTHGEKMFIAFAEVIHPLLRGNGSVWMVFIDREAKEVFAPLRSLMLQLLIVTGVLIVILLPVAFVFSGRFVKPIKQLREITEHIGKGELDYPIEIKTGDEIEQFADSLRDMVFQIKERQKEILAEKKYTDGIISSMVDALFVINPDGAIRRVNKAILDLLGYTEKELIGQPGEKLFAAIEVAEEKLLFDGTRLKRLIEKGSARNFDMTYVTKSGEKIPISFSGSVMYESDPVIASEVLNNTIRSTHDGQRIIGIVGVARDMRRRRALITDLERSKAELQEWSRTLEKKVEERTKALTQSQEATINLLEDLRESREKLEKAYDALALAQGQVVRTEKLAAIGQLCAGTAHELNNPLTGILGSVQILLRDLQKKGGFILKDTGNRKEFTEVLQSAEIDAHRCRTIIRNLLDFTMERDVEGSDADINKLIDEALPLVKRQVALEDIEIRKKYDPGMPRIRVDKEKLKQVFINVILNAGQAMFHGGVLTISTKLEENFINISFSDTGCGI